MASRRMMLAPLLLAPVAGFALWRAGEGEPVGGAYAVGAAHNGGLHLSDDATAPLWRELMRGRRDRPLGAPSFSSVVADLDGRTVSLRGFMVTLQDAPAHRRFLFAPNPPGCPGCRPSDAFSLLDARGEKPLPPSDGPIMLSGVLRLRRNEELVYRLDGAVLVAG